ncbi:putative signal transduction protein with Nacht domain (plasmid) [Calothrix brevissima NIES-22]|nr:putative signal transduction protein with Nacht domain [Calothrix brevissima NIES-22]
MCLLYQSSLKIPTNRATLYERALRVLLEEWAGEKGISQEDLYKGLDTKRKEMILSEIAHHAFQEDRLFLSRREIADKFEKLLAEMLSDEKFINGVDVLKSIEVQHGILVERAYSIYCFSHLTLQEYLTAQYIDDHRQIEKLVTEHLTEESWKEVFLLVAGLMRGGADSLLLLMQKQAQKYLSNPNLQSLLNWAEQETAGSESNFKPIAKRMTALIIALDIARLSSCELALSLDLLRVRLRAIDLTIALAIDFVLTSNRDINSTIELDIIIDRKSTNAINLTFANVTCKDNDALAIHRSKNITRDFNLALARAEDLEKRKIFKSVNFIELISAMKLLKIKASDYMQSHETSLEFRENLLKLWKNTLNLDPKLVNLSKKEAKALENYFYINWLIVKCKQASVRVLPTTWKGIEEQMLLFLKSSPTGGTTTHDE